MLRTKPAHKLIGLYAFLAALVLMLLIPAPARSAEPERAGLTGNTEISAKALTRDGDIYEAEGGVEIRKGSALLKADKVRYDAATEDLVAEGGVTFEDSETLMRARRMQINLKGRVGVLFDAEVLVKERGFRIRGPHIEKTGPSRYILKRGSFTACPGETPDWCISGRNVDIIVGNRVRAGLTVFRIRNVPVFVTPFLWAPAAVDRKTGFLLPTLGYTDQKGIFYRQPFFWAITQKRDATVFADLYSRRGWGAGGEYRYVETPGIRGSINVHHIRDNSLDIDYQEVRAVHRHRAGWFAGFIDLSLVSQKDFYRRYQPYLKQSSRRFLESQGEVAAHAGPVKFYVRGRYLQDLGDGADQSAILQRLPVAGVFAGPVSLGGLVFTLEGSAANFERETGIGGRRYDTRLHLDHTIGVFPALYMGATLSGTYYDLPGGTDDDIVLPAAEYRAELRGSVRRAYGKYQHVITPYVGYHHLWLEESKTPPEFDSLEALRNTQALEAGLVNRIRGPKGDILTTRLGWAYDFKREPEPVGPLMLRARVGGEALSLSFGVDYDFNLHSVVATDSSLRAEIGRVRLGAGHYHRRDEETMYTADLALGLTDAIEVSAGMWYDSEGGGLNRLSVGVLYQSECWVLGAEFVRRPGEYHVMLKFSIAGIGDSAPDPKGSPDLKGPPDPKAPQR